MGRFARMGNDLYSAKRSIDFIGRRRRWYTIAVIAVLLSMLALGVRGLNPGIEFRGGSEFQVSQVRSSGELAGQRAVSSAAPGTQARVSVLRDLTSRSRTIRVQTAKLTDAQTELVKTKLATAYGVPVSNVTSSFVGPSWGSDVTSKAVQGLLVFLLFVAAVIAGYFRTWKMAIAALIALLHDLLITVGVYAAVGFEVTPASVIGFLTILGYSLYDTVVVFDKVRENTEHVTASTKRTYGEAANLAVNQTLVRSINTSVVALLPVASILFIGAFLLGAGTLKDISLALFVGIASGTYSSIFIATPLLVDLRRNEPALVAQEERVRRRRRDEAARSTVPAEPVSVQAGAAALGQRSGQQPRTTSGASATQLATDTSAAGQRAQPRRSGRGRPGGPKR